MNKTTLIFGGLFFIVVVTIVILIATGVIDLSSLFGSTTKTPGSSATTGSSTTPGPSATTGSSTTPGPSATTGSSTTTGPPNHTYPPTPIVTTPPLPPLPPGHTYPPAPPSFFGYSCNLFGQSDTQGKCYLAGRDGGKFSDIKACKNSGCETIRKPAYNCNIFTGTCERSKYNIGKYNDISSCNKNCKKVFPNKT